MRLRTHPGARRDLDTAVNWYIAEAGSPTAARFLDEVERLKAVIVEYPHLGTPARSGARSLIFRSFPYSLVYRVRGDTIQVIAFAHHSRRPDYWTGRT
jgi:plasmid stabilization system protein ParE